MSITCKTILGLDLGTNSIGWSLVQQNFEEKYGKILGLGSRIIPMSQDVLGDFGKGNSISQTAERTRLRSVRRLRERHLLRRERLHRVLNVLGFLPEHYAARIDFAQRLGKFLPETEIKLAYDDNRQFIFKKSFEEMLADFRQYQPMLVSDGKKVPYDWTIYYLRKKALTRKLEQEELAWLLLHFNQKRGYYQLRGEDAEEKENKLEEFYSLRVTDVTADEPQKGKAAIWYNIILENGWIYRRESKVPLFDWKEKVRDFIVTTDLNDDGSIKKDKEGKEKRSFRSPGEDDWKLRKKKTEADVARSCKTVGEYIYDTLLQEPSTKIKGKLVRTIERKFYKDELRQILQKQIELNPKLQNKDIYQECVDELYPHNLDHNTLLSSKDFLHLFIEDILYYQRPLRSQKHTISNCPLEKRIYIHDGTRKADPIKCVPKSHPLYQEFRLWQWISNLRIFDRADDVNETEKYLSNEEDISALFNFLNARKEIDQETLLKHFKLKKGHYRWNYVEDKKYPCNETRGIISSRLNKVANIPDTFLTSATEAELWHIIYSVTDKIDFEKALKSFASKHNLDVNSFFEAFKKFPPFPNMYGAYSAKALKKLLPIMRTGRHWDYEAIDGKTKARIEKILDGEYDETIKDRVREKAIKLTTYDHFKGLPEWLAKYIVYDRHSERAEIGKWNTVADLEKYLNEFRQHSLKNPIVEQVVTEALRVVKDIWVYYGNSAENFFDEIHIELGRELKLPAVDRKTLSTKMVENENTNLRIKALLAEMINDGAVENVRPHSPMQQEILKIYEDGVLNNDIEIPEDIAKISRLSQPSRSELQRYKLWLEQKYRSPYTGEIIPLNKLFTPAYEIEHVIPQSRYFDDSLSNKVICEASVNTLKGNQTGLEFIQNHHGEVVDLGMGKKVTILSETAYSDFVNQHYAQSRSKKNKLLALEIPEKMIERQLNDTRYISRFIMQLLSNIVRGNTNDEGPNSKNVLPVNGQITAALRKDWGLDAVWNDLILPRFERLNELTGTNHFTAYNERHQKYLPAVPLELQKGFQKKRIDHRHHALDALIIGCATRNHINYLNNQHALGKAKEQKQSARHDLRALLCDKKYNDGSDEHYNWIFKQPWNGFITEVKKELEETIVSIKQNLRILNRTSNSITKIIDGKKIAWCQQGGNNWAIRKPLHKDTVAGLVSLRRVKTVSLSSALNEPYNIVEKSIRKSIQALEAKGYDKKKLVKHFKDKDNLLDGQDISKLNVYYWENDNVASRVPLDTSFTKERIQTITDTGIQTILVKHLEGYDNSSERAFSPEGIEDLNKNIVSLNNNKFHQPILKVRTYEPKGNKFQVGSTGNKKNKWVEAAKGTNLFFAIYKDEAGKRSFQTVPLNIVIERMKQGLKEVPDTDDDGRKIVDYLSPNDLVYLPTEDELQNGTPINLTDVNKEQLKHIYKIVSFTGGRLYAVPCHVAKAIVDKVEFSQLNKVEFTAEKTSIRDVCVKIKVNRLGRIISSRPSLSRQIEASILTKVDLPTTKEKTSD